jgi:hypothetical protein
MKKKNLLTLLGLCVLLAVCICLYFFVPQGEDSDEEDQEQTEEDITVDTIDSDSIEKITVQKNGKTSYTLVKSGDNWKLSGQKDVPLDESKVTNLFDCLNPVSATKSLEKTDSAMSEYGLDSPAYTITVSAGENEYRYDLGIEVPVEGGYYGVSSSNDDTIYCLSDSMVSDLDIDSKTLIVRDELPDDIEDDYMVYLKVDNKNKSNFEAEVVDEEDRVESYSKWNITQPYKKPLATSTADWSTILGYFDSLEFGNLVEYNAKKLDKYGLKNPSSVITVRYYETTDDYEPEATATADDSLSTDTDTETEVPEKYRKYHTLKLYIGKKKGESYYACKKGSNNVYLMNGDVVENMTKLDVYDAMDHCVYATLATDIDGYEAIYGNKKISVTRKSKTSDDGTEKNVWKMNGVKISEDDESEFLTPYSSAYLLEYSAIADDSVKPKKKDPVLTMIYHDGKKDVTVKYYPYDGTNFYRVDRDGMNYFLVDKRSVDDIIKRFKNIEKFGEK